MYLIIKKNNISHNQLRRYGGECVHGRRNLLREEQSDYYLKRYEYAGFNRMEMSNIINYRDNTRVITDYRYDSFGRRIHTAERTKSGIRTIYDGLTFEVVKEAETFPQRC